VKSSPGNNKKKDSANRLSFKSQTEGG